MAKRKKAKSGALINVSLAEVQKARRELSKMLPATPLLFNSWLSQSMGCEVYLKLETAQPIGSFKIRGATYRISQLTKAQRRRGVIAASAGNHSQGLAWGAKHFGVNALIVMPVGAPLVKLQNTQDLGAQVILEGSRYDEAYAHALQIAKKSGRVFVHAYEDPCVIAGQGTVGLEIFDQLPDVDCVVGSVGGGGLMAGVSIALKALKPQVKILACQASGAATMVKSIEAGKALTLSGIKTFADGIAVSHASEPMRQRLAAGVDEWVTVDEDAIAAAVLTLLEKGKIVTEGAGAAPLAAFQKVSKKFKNKKVVLIISGGNIDVNLLSRIIDIGLIHAGRRVRVNVVLSDHPGSLADLTQFIASQGANILQAIHDRNEPAAKMDQAEVALTLETRGPEHSAKLIDALKREFS
jgi:threonine dehydratase